VTCGNVLDQAPALNRNSNYFACFWCENMKGLEPGPCDTGNRIPGQNYRRDGGTSHAWFSLAVNIDGITIDIPGARTVDILRDWNPSPRYQY